MSTSPKQFMVWNGKAFEDDYGLHITVDDGRVYECSSGSYGGGHCDMPGGSDHQEGRTVIQYTGVNDDAGAKLYETDVVDTELGRAVIGFQHGFYCLNWLEDDGGISECNVELIGNDWKGRKREYLIRLGNSLENPELKRTA